MPRHKGTHGEDAPAGGLPVPGPKERGRGSPLPRRRKGPRWEGYTENGEIVTLAGAPRRRSLHHDGGEGTNARAEDPLTKTSFAGTTRQAKERQPLYVDGVRTCPRCMVGAQRGAGGKHWARIGLCPTWEYSPGPTTPLASGDSTKSYH